MKSPLVSIVTPAYNAQATISLMIESVISQTYQNWELLIVDDCSTDNTKELVKEFCRKDDRIKYFCTDHPTGGPAVPRNIAIENSQGEYVAFLDADDQWLPNKLEKQVRFCEENNYSFTYSNYEKMTWDGKRDARIVKTREVTNYNDLLLYSSIPCLTTFIKRSLIGDSRFKNIPQEDFCFWLDLLKKGNIAYNMCDVTALYREAKNSRSANKLNMVIAHWNVIRKFQHIGLLKACLYMMTYSFLGFVKYIK